LLELQGKDPTLSPCHPVTPTPSADWNPAQYERFRDERSAPFYDLLDLVEPRPGMRVVDLGCGTGALTREMHRRLTARETVGIDTSPAMLARSAAIAGEGLRF
jgi:trans-aconitate 2-methyltransferase